MPRSSRRRKTNQTLYILIPVISILVISLLTAVVLLATKGSPTKPSTSPVQSTNDPKTKSTQSPLAAKAPNAELAWPALDDFSTLKEGKLVTMGGRVSEVYPSFYAAVQSDLEDELRSLEGLRRNDSVRWRHKLPGELPEPKLPEKKIPVVEAINDPVVVLTNGSIWITCHFQNVSFDDYYELFQSGQMGNWAAIRGKVSAVDTEPKAALLQDCQWIRRPGRK